MREKETGGVIAEENGRKWQEVFFLRPVLGLEHTLGIWPYGSFEHYSLCSNPATARRKNEDDMLRGPIFASIHHTHQRPMRRIVTAP